MKTIAIIPARGGSKRIPRKNMRRIGGTSLVGWSVRECLRAGFDTCVSTDDTEIASEARKYGALVIDRPAELATDTSTSEDVMRHALGEIGASPDDVAVMVQCTSPFTTAEELRKAVADAAYERTVFACRKRAEYHWDVSVVGGKWEAANHDPSEPRTGEPTCEPLTVETGAFYARTVNSWLAVGERFCCSRPWPVEVSHPVDIDTPEDFDHAQIDYLIRPALHAMNAPARKIAAVVFDVDGVLTTGHVGVESYGAASMLFSRRDGAAMSRMIERGIAVRWVTAEHPMSPAFARAAKLSMPCQLVGADDRLSWLREFAASHALDLDQVAYVGDSDTDAEALAAVGAGFAPRDAMPGALMAARYIVGSGGHHVAEHVDALLRGWR